jgi:hypothetical protein
VVVRALSLFSPGELRELHVTDANIFRLALTTSTGECNGTAPRVDQVLGSLCAVGFHPQESFSPEALLCADAFIERYAATITALDGLPCEPYATDASVLARCFRLESLTSVSAYTPAVWLGLSQLHTLRGVDLGQVSTAAIAAALPRLHTLTAFRYDVEDEDCASALGFFTDLLPRLRVFHFNGTWPNEDDGEAAEEGGSSVLPLPELQELVWRPFEHQAAPRQFLAAEPTLLRARHDLITKFVNASRGSRDGPTSGPLARVRELDIIKPYAAADPLEPSDVARVLLAAPQLRSLRVFHSVYADLLTAAPDDSTFVGLLHTRLWALAAVIVPPFEFDAECAARLRHNHFPRLRVLTVDGKTHFATPA